MLHAERREDVLRDVLVERLARHALDDVAGERGGVVGIRGRGARRVDALGDPVLEGRVERRGSRFSSFAISPRITSSMPAVWVMMLRSVTGLPSYGGILKSMYLLTSSSRSSLPCSTSCITAVQVNSLETEPGRNSVRCRIDRRALGQVGVAVALLQQHLAVLHHDDDRAGDVGLLQRVRHEAVEPGFQVGRR